MPATAGGPSMREVLAATGEVGSDLLDVDWSATSLGDPDGWSPSLRSAVRILLTSRFSMWMAWGPDLTFLCNEAYKRDTLGSKYPWALGRPASEVWSEIWPDIGPRIAHVTTTGEATWDESLLLFLERSGYVEETYHTFSYSPLADDDGTVSGMLCVVAEVTEQVISERRMDTLRDLGVRSGTAADEAQAVVAACDHLAGNPASLPFVAVYLFDDDGSCARLAGTAGIEPGHPAVPPELPAASEVWPVAAAWAGTTTLVEDLDSRFAVLPTGAWDRPPHQALVAPVPRPTGSHPYGFLVVGVNPYCPVDASYRDFVDLVVAHLASAVTDARALADQRERAEGLAALDQAKSDFLANVSHELRTPLTLLLGPAEDALADPGEPLAADQRRRVEVVLRNARRMLQLVNSLLDVARLESGRDDATYVPTDLAGYTAELASMFSWAAERAGLRLEVRCPAPVAVHVDRDHWSKVVTNLLSNALKHTFEGTVTVSVVERDGRAVLEVGDTGTGIPEAELPALFDRFHRVAGARSRSFEGSGIGLALVEQLVRAHGGTVAVRSTEGEGTTFTVSLPLGTAHLPAAQLRASAVDTDDVVRRHRDRVATDTASWAGPGTDAPPEPPSPDGGAGTVLVVDDNADLRAYIVDLLRADGYAVRGVADGQEAVEVLHAADVDLVLTDVMMPRLDGFGLLRAIRADQALAGTPVIMLSARAGEEGTLDGLQAGADDYLAKPFSARELLARVRTHLALDRAESVQRALERSGELLDQAQRLANLGSWEIDLATDTMSASDTFVEMLGLTHGDLARLGTTEVMARRVHPDDLPRVTETLQLAAPGVPVEYETRIVLPAGEERLFAVRGMITTDGDAELLRGSFQDITDQRLTQQRLIAAEAAQEAAARERAIADQLQQSLLPAESVAIEALDVATHYRAGAEGTQVGGDWYDVLDLGGGRTAIVVGDVMGRGVRAAAVTGQLRAAMRALLRLDLGPAQVLHHLDGMVQELADEQIVTCFLGVLDAADLTLDFASAGHLPVLVSTTAGPHRLGCTGPPLGTGFEADGSARARLAAGDVVALYTDGLVERRDHDLLDDIAELADELHRVRLLPAAAQVEQVVATMDGRGPGTVDDTALLLLRLGRPDEGRVLRRRLGHDDSTPASARTAVSSHLEACAVPPQVRDDVVLGVSELVTNAVQHARPPLALTVSCTERRVVVEVADHDVLRPERRRAADDDENGRGLQIVDALASSWGTRRIRGGKVVWCAMTW